MIATLGKNIKGAFTGGKPVKAIYSFGVKVFPNETAFGGLTFEGVDSVNTIGFSTMKEGVSLQYMKEGGNWTPFTSTDVITLNQGEKMYVKGINDTLGDETYSLTTRFKMTGSVKASGNIMSLLYGDDLTKTTVSVNAFRNLFRECPLITAPELPATILADSCYRGMFFNCTTLSTAPELPATTMVVYCYASMFRGCTSLTTAPELPAITMENNCYEGMFYGCTSLTKAPELPATTLGIECYREMFQNCTALTTAPSILPATIMIDGSCRGMFNGCTSLTKAPELPATEVGNRGYYYMFSGCTSLVKAPVLPATQLFEYCYDHMFYGCSNLNEITCYADNIVATSCTGNWVTNVAPTGTFYKLGSANFSRGNNGIPTGWTISTDVLTYKWVEKTWNKSFFGDDIWRDSTGNIYATYTLGSTNPYSYQLVNGEWVNKSWNINFEGSNIWQDNDGNIYTTHPRTNQEQTSYVGSDTYKLVNGSWNKISSSDEYVMWGDSVWKDNDGHIYSSSAYDQQLEFVNGVWVEKDWGTKVPYYNFIWKDNDGHIYYSNGSSQQYELVNGVWIEKDWGTLKASRGNSVWKDNDGHIYYSFEMTSPKQLELVNGVWVEKDWGTKVPRSGYHIWKDNDGHIYHSNGGSSQYELVEA